MRDGAGDERLDAALALALVALTMAACAYMAYSDRLVEVFMGMV